MATKNNRAAAPVVIEGGPASELRLTETHGKTREQLLADLSTEGLFTNAALLQTFGKNLTGDTAITETVQALRSTVAQVNRGDLAAAETLLMTQAAALNAMFGELARRSGANMGVHLDAADRYMRLALKAQGQCRATLETLANIKNPPVVFARQANINNGGQQQVNNGAAPIPDQYAQTPAGGHTANREAAPVELLETSDGERLDTRAAGAASGADPHVAPVGAVDRPADA